MRRLICAAAAAALTNIVNPAIAAKPLDPVVSVSGLPVEWNGLPSNKAAEGARALSLFMWGCDGFDSRRGDISNIKATVSTAATSGKLSADYGWNRIVYVAVSLKPNSTFPSAWNLNGQTLNYVFGGGDNPGIYQPTEKSRAACENKKPYRPNDWDSMHDSHYMSVVDDI